MSRLGNVRVAVRPGIRTDSRWGRLTSGLDVVKAVGALAVVAVVGWYARFLTADEARDDAHEDQLAEEIKQAILEEQATEAAKQDRPLRRGTHTKGTCVRATFEVFDIAARVRDPVLARRLAHGIFAKPGYYEATVRFANGMGQVQPDSKRDIRALSIAVHVPAGTFGPAAFRQDFAMNDSPIFQANDARAFAMAYRELNARNVVAGLRAIPLRDRIALLRTGVLSAFALRAPKRPYQQMRYWSTVPFSHGATETIKYSAVPHPGNPAQKLGDGPNRLQDELARHVANDDQMSSFDFSLQLLDVSRMQHWGRRRAAAYWIENASIEWRESQAPFHTVARLTLVPGAESVFSRAACEREYIDVTANTHPDTRPVGSINRARWAAEAASREARLAAADSP